MKYTKEQLKTINSLRKVDDHIYTLHYQNDYGRDEIINGNAKGLISVYRNIQKYFKSTQPLINPIRPNGGCVGITANNKNNEMLFARNFDYKETNCLITWIDNKKGYKSLCMVDFTFLGYGIKHFKIENSNKARLLAAPFVCMDGMNEKGLGISIIEVKFDPTRQNTGKTKLHPTLLLRLALDTCSTIDEVTELFNNYDMQGILGNDYHYHVTDVNGDAAVYEFINNKLHIIRNNEKKYYPHKYMYVPSFFIAKEGNNVNKTIYAQERYDIMKEDMTKNNGVYSELEVMRLLEKCKTHHPHRWMPHTVISIWSIVYNLNNGTALVCSNNNFKDIYEVNLYNPQIIKNKKI